ncbi:probable serine/threonine-protein kinase pats1 [Anneissia japonica]|uniref:probable serine/threonine-protein kinase pats1 n=1 Tax=Anneissia japonica TaxID=1529436 RepID=UPI0014256470|nr:probable serine/threonine-protein kinase pats1 [Anneissia japonica]
MMKTFPQEIAASTPPNVIKEDIQRVLEIIQGIEKQGQNEGLEETVDDLTLSIWDFAGQDVYYITHQMFLVSRAIYILCFDLRHDLHKPVPVLEGEKVSSFECRMTYLEFIIFWLQSIYSHTTENPTVREQEQSSPPVYIVGTHKDMLPGNEEQKNALPLSHCSE